MKNTLHLAPAHAAWGGERKTVTPKCRCGALPELLTCADCGHTACVLRCGHGQEPGEVAASVFAGGEATCQRCEREREWWAWHDAYEGDAPPPYSTVEAAEKECRRWCSGVDGARGPY